MEYSGGFRLFHLDAGIRWKEWPKWDKSGEANGDASKDGKWDPKWKECAISSFGSAPFNCVYGSEQDLQFYNSVRNYAHSNRKL